MPCPDVGTEASGIMQSILGSGSEAAGMRFDVDRLLALLSESARGSVRLVVVNFPHNPASTIYISKPLRIVKTARAEMRIDWDFILAHIDDCTTMSALCLV